LLSFTVFHKGTVPHCCRMLIQCRCHQTTTLPQQSSRHVCYNPSQP
jgi:hypothetical protein